MLRTSRTFNWRLIGGNLLPKSVYIHVVADDEKAAASSRRPEGLSPSLLEGDTFVFRRSALLDDVDDADDGVVSISSRIANFRFRDAEQMTTG